MTQYVRRAIYIYISCWARFLTKTHSKNCKIDEAWYIKGRKLFQRGSSTENNKKDKTGVNLRPQSKPYIIYIYSQKDVFKSVFTLIKNGSTNLWIKIYSTELCLSLDWFQKVYNIYLLVVEYFIAWVWLDVHYKSIPKKLVPPSHFGGLCIIYVGELMMNRLVFVRDIILCFFNTSALY